MPSRSRMAALSLVACAILGAAPIVQGGSASCKNHVKLELQISGLKQGECEVEIKPGHAGCRFVPVVKRIRGTGSDLLKLDPILAESINADRDCAFAITIREQGEPDRTYRRGVRLDTPTAKRPLPAQSVTCYISSPSVANRGEAPSRRR